MRLVVVTQVVDADHPALGQTIDIVGALARRCDEVVVICDHVGRYVPPAQRPVCERSVRLRGWGAVWRSSARSLPSSAAGTGAPTLCWRT